jgi:hypothetical protein
MNDPIERRLRPEYRPLYARLRTRGMLGGEPLSEAAALQWLARDRPVGELLVDAAAGAEASLAERFKSTFGLSESVAAVAAEGRPDQFPLREVPRPPSQRGSGLSPAEEAREHYLQTLQEVLGLTRQQAEQRDRELVAESRRKGSQ